MPKNSQNHTKICENACNFHQNSIDFMQNNKRVSWTASSLNLYAKHVPYNAA